MLPGALSNLYDVPFGFSSVDCTPSTLHGLNDFVSMVRVLVSTIDSRGLIEANGTGQLTIKRKQEDVARCQQFNSVPRVNCTTLI